MKRTTFHGTLHISALQSTVPEHDNQIMIEARTSNPRRIIRILMAPEDFALALTSQQHRCRVEIAENE